MSEDIFFCHSKLRNISLPRSSTNELIQYFNCIYSLDAQSTYHLAILEHYLLVSNLTWSANRVEEAVRNTPQVNESNIYSTDY